MRKLLTLTMFGLSLFGLAQTSHTVNVGGSGATFVPATLTINQGDTVNWDCTAGTHNVDGSIATNPTNPVGFGNGTAAMAPWVYQFVFNTPGTYSYECTPHAGIGMTGSITVVAASVPCSNLFFSEYIEGSSNNKGFEIYNPTTSAIDLGTYKVYEMVNGGPSVNIFSPVGSLASGDVYTVCTNQSSATMLAAADTALAYPSVSHFNGDDALFLVDTVSGDTIDIIGVIGIDPGSSWPVGTGSTANYTLVRKANVTAGQTDWTIGATEWDVYPIDTWTYLGGHSSNSCATYVAPCSNLFFSEYIEGSSNNKGFEIYNPTMGAIDLGTYKVYEMVNGGPSVNVFSPVGSLASGGVYSVCTDQSSATMLATADTALSYPSVAHFNGDDALFLVDTVTNDTIDIIGVIGVDPGSSWPVGTGSTANYTLVRKATVNAGQTDWTVGATEWDVHPIDTYTYFGSHTSNCVAGPATPTVKFLSSSISVLENAGTVDVDLFINPTSSSAQTVDIHVNLGPGVTVPGDGTIVPAPSMTTGIVTLNVPANADTVSFQVVIVDDQLTENDEYVDLTIDAVSSGLTIGSVDSLRFTIEDNDIIVPTYTIDQIDGRNADCALDSSTVYVRVYGVVMGVDMQGVASSNSAFSIWDGEGFGVFAGGLNFTVVEGDSVRVIGELGEYNGLAQVYADSIVVVKSGSALPTPVVVTALSEATESELVRFNNATLVDPTQWGSGSSGFNVDITNGTDTIALRVDVDVTDVYAMPAPIGTFDVIGIGGQFDNSAPRCEGYQLLPRYLSDIILPEPPTYDLHISEVMANSNDANGLNQDWFEITNYSSTETYNLANFSFDDNSEIDGLNIFPSVNIAPGEAIVVWEGVMADEATFIANWNIVNGAPQIISSDELLNGSFPGLSSSADAVVLYDSSANVIEICKVDYTSTIAGQSLEFDTNCAFVAFSVDGVNGAHTSNGGDVGSPGNVAPGIGLSEANLAKVRIFPNPTHGQMTLEMPFEGAKEIRIMDIRGALFEVIQTNESSLEMNMNRYDAGVYMLQIKSGDSQRVVRVVLQ